MATTITVEPATLAISLADAKAHCHISGSVEDDVITGYIKAATEFCQGFTNRQFVNATYRTTLDYFPDSIRLLPCPLVSVTSISYVDTDGDSQTLDAFDYQVITTDTVGRIVPSYGNSFPSTRSQPASVTITWVAGYGTADNVPQKARQAIRFLVSHYNENREAVGGPTSVVPLAVESLLWQLRVVEVV